MPIGERKTSMSQQESENPHYVWTPERPFQALALTGGGYRGLFTARALQVMEEKIGEPIGRRFDLVCGTSIGGIIALAIAFEVPMADVVAIFEKRGEEIFPPHTAPGGRLAILLDILRHLYKARYSAVALRDAIKQLIPESKTLADALHPVAIPAINVTAGKPQVFKSRHDVSWHRDWKYLALDVALATSAAPTFFPLAEISNNRYVDGGLFANAPDLIAFHEANHYFKVPPRAMRILSVGTTGQSYSISNALDPNVGIAEWMLGQRLFNVTISSQQIFVYQLLNHLLEGNYLRIDHDQSDEQVRDLGLDVATAAARKTLLGLGEKIATDALGTKLKPYLSHKPQLRIHREQTID